MRVVRSRLLGVCPRHDQGITVAAVRRIQWCHPFIERGYAAATIEAIAAEAGIAVQTLCFTFSTERAILTELVDIEVAGDTAPVATLDRAWVAEAMTASPVEQIRLHVTATATILDSVSCSARCRSWRVAQHPVEDPLLGCGLLLLRQFSGGGGRGDLLEFAADDSRVGMCLSEPVPDGFPEPDHPFGHSERQRDDR
jgi:AcrR family transcriptional regulator